VDTAGLELVDATELGVELTELIFELTELGVELTELVVLVAMLIAVVVVHVLEAVVVPAFELVTAADFGSFEDDFDEVVGLLFFGLLSYIDVEGFCFDIFLSSLSVYYLEQQFIKHRTGVNFDYLHCKYYHTFTYYLHKF